MMWIFRLGWKREAVMEVVNQRDQDDAHGVIWKMDFISK